MSGGAEKEGTVEVPATHACRQMLEFLVCPVTRGRLAYDPVRQELVSTGAGLAFQIHNGIPVMLVDEARRLED